MAYIYPLNNPERVYLTVFDFTHLSPPPIIKDVLLLVVLLGQYNHLYV